MKSLIIFDGDDTLWYVEPLYDAARIEAQKIVEAAGLDGQRWDSLERGIDVQNVARMGFSSRRFPTSCVEAYRMILEEAGLKPQVEVADQIWSAASSVFEEKAPLVEHAVPILVELLANHRLVLLTRGEEWLQRRRIAQSGLKEFFEREIIVQDKNASTFLDVAKSVGMPSDATWSVGNSLRSDIYPAIQAGMRAIWIDAHVWEYEKVKLEDHARLWQVSSVAEVPTVIKHVEGRPTLAQEELG